LNPIQAEALTAIKINRKFEFVPVLLFNKEKYLYLKSQLISLINNSDDKNINKQLNDLCCNELVYGNMARERLNCIKEVLFDLEEM
jgi:hypothetical protein